MLQHSSESRAAGGAQPAGKMTIDLEAGAVGRDVVDCSVCPNSSERPGESIELSLEHQDVFDFCMVLGCFVSFSCKFFAAYLFNH